MPHIGLSHICLQKRSSFKPTSAGCVWGLPRTCDADAQEYWANWLL